MNRFILKTFVVLAVALGGCTEYTLPEVPISSESTEASLSVFSELLSTFDVVSDFSSSNKLFLKKDQSLLPNGLIINYIDTIYKDGNGVIIELDFGSLGDEPRGLLCKDNKYRAGKILMTLDRPITEPNAQFQITFSKEEPYYTGNGKDMTQLIGSMQLVRISETLVKLTMKDLNATIEDQNQSISGYLDIFTIKESGIGIINDELAIEGILQVISPNSTIELSTVKPLMKNYKLECAKHIVDGDLKADILETNSTIDIDFDPDQDQACDNKVSMTINGKTVIYIY